MLRHPTLPKGGGRTPKVSAIGLSLAISKTAQLINKPFNPGAVPPPAGTRNNACVQPGVKTLKPPAIKYRRSATKISES